MVNILGGPHPRPVGRLYDGYPHALARDPQLRVHLYGKDLRGRAARSATSTPTATTSGTACSGPGTPPPGSAGDLGDESE